MMTKQSLFALTIALAVMLAGIAPAVASDEMDSLSVAVDQSGEEPVVTVTQNGSAAENASVTVAVVNNSSYAGVGEYATDGNGTVSLPAPTENATVEVTAMKGNASGSTTVELLAAEEDEEDENDDEMPEFDNFGERVSWFVHSLLDGDIEGGLGQMVSEFVTSNNPGADNRPDHAGPGGDDESDNSTAESSGQGGPDQSDSGSDDGGNGNGHGNGHGDDHPGKGHGKEKALRSAW